MSPGRFKTPRNRRLPRDVYAEIGTACFLTIRSYERARPFIRADLNDAVVSVLMSERLVSACCVYAYCLMPDHLHLLAAPRVEGSSLLRFVDRFKALSARASWRYRWRGKLWQPRSYDHVLRRDQDVAQVADYILTNPIRAGLVVDAARYRWQGLVDPIAD